MQTPSLAAVASVACVVGALSGCAKESAPPIFANMTLAEAKSAVKGTHKILVVKATAEWCTPCKIMNETTWRDERVAKWFAENGMVIALDIDKYAHDARTLRIMSIPTLIAYREDQEFDRLGGLKDADALLAWLQDVKAGKVHTN